MKTLPAPPYLLPHADAIVERPWTDADGRELPDRLEHWDPFTDTELFRTIDVDLDAIRDGCRLNTDAAVAVSTAWYSNRTRLSGIGVGAELGKLTGVVRASISVTVPGALSGGRLELRTSLILRHPGTGASLISPRREGAVLWVQSTSVALEGAAARFPVTALNFSASPLPDHAAWKLEWNAEALEDPVLGDVRLLVNANNETLLAALRSGAADPRSSATRAFVMFDVARALVHGALGNERFVDDPEAFEEGSVGRMLFELLTMYWPGVPVKTLATRNREDPARLEAELQAHLQLFR